MSEFLDQRAAEAVREMTSLGAVFETDGVTAWSWEARPPIMRNAIAHYVDESIGGLRFYVGFDAAMVAAIERFQAEGRA